MPTHEDVSRSGAVRMYIQRADESPTALGCPERTVELARWFGHG